MTALAVVSTLLQGCLGIGSPLVGIGGDVSFCVFCTTQGNDAPIITPDKKSTLASDAVRAGGQVLSSIINRPRPGRR